jgi:hypothetical protein
MTPISHDQKVIKMSALRPRLGPVTRIVVGLAAVAFVVGAVLGIVWREWLIALCCGVMAFLCTYGAVMGIDLYADHPGQQTFKRWKPGSEGKGDADASR